MTPKRTVTHMFTDGVQRQISVLDAEVMLRLEDCYRESRIEALRRFLGKDDPQLRERLLEETVRVVPFYELQEWIRSMRGMQSAAIEALLVANPDMKRQEASALCAMVADLIALLNAMTPAAKQRPDPTPASAHPATGELPEATTMAKPMDAAAASASAS